MLVLQRVKYIPVEVHNKIVYGLERIADAFKTLLWRTAKDLNVSPIQIQLILFIRSHKVELCTVTHLAKEFNLTKATISDAIRVLVKKELLEKDYSIGDNRSYTLQLTSKGGELIEKLSGYTALLQNSLTEIDEEAMDNLYDSITNVISALNKSGVIQVQRLCYSCRFYEGKDEMHFCNLLNQELALKDIQLDCPEHELHE